MVGGESESGGDDDSAKAGRASLEEAGTPRHALAKHRHQQAAAACCMPAAHLSSPPLNASSEAAAWSDRKQEPSGISGRPRVSAAGPHTGGDAFAGSSARHSARDEETEPAWKGQKGNGRVEGQLGKKQKHGKKGKPQSQLQLMQAQVQAQKARRAKAVPILKRLRLAELTFHHWHHKDVLSECFLCTESLQRQSAAYPFCITPHGSLHVLQT